MSNSFHARRRVEFVETDSAGIVHFSNFFRWMEAAEVDFLHERGLSVRMTFEGQNFGFPRVSATCDYMEPLFFEDFVDIKVTLEKLGAKSATYTFEFSRDGMEVAKGKVVSVCCRIRQDRTLESVEIPAKLREKLLATS